MSSNKVLTASLFALTTVSTAAFASAQSQGIDAFRRETAAALTAKPRTEEAASTNKGQAVTDLTFASRKDSLEWAKYKKIAAKSTGFRVIVSLKERHLWVVTDEDTLLSAPAAVARGNTLSYGGIEKTFDTPRGLRHVLKKDADPVWNPPDWLYAETAQEYGFQIKYISPKGTMMPDGRKLIVQDNQVKVVLEDGTVTSFPVELHIIFGNTLYVPPVGTDNRRINGTLGKYKLDLGEGYLFHGTNIPTSIGLAATHGCIRLRDEDIEWLYDNVPIGTKVYIY